MNTLAEIVRRPGFLRGMAREAECTVEMWKEASSSGRVYSRCRITDEPTDLPDGPYTVFFAGRRIHTAKWWGRWSLSFLPQSFDLDQAA